MEEDNVFINCPFDNHYFPLLKALLYTIIYLGLKPKISETSDSGQNRINTIQQLMKDSRYSIHDLSRMEPLESKKLPRFNMPFECGIDFGIKFSGIDEYKSKKFLILEKLPFRYHEVISDISGNDIRSHKNDPESLIKAVRDWFKINISSVPNYKEIWLSYVEFEYNYEMILRDEELNPKDINALTFQDIIEYMETFISEYKAN